MPRMRFGAPVLTQPVTPVTVTPTGSPFVYAPTRATLVLVTGGTVSLIELSTNGGVSYLTVGVLAGQQLVPPGSSLRITYLTAPTITALPL